MEGLPGNNRQFRDVLSASFLAGTAFFILSETLAIEDGFNELGRAHQAEHVVERLQEKGGLAQVIAEQRAEAAQHYEYASEDWQRAVGLFVAYPVVSVVVAGVVWRRHRRAWSRPEDTES